jgi:hypothetical protein
MAAMLAERSGAPLPRATNVTAAKCPQQATTPLT